MPVRVLSVPSGHVYVRHLSSSHDDVVRLPDPPVPGDVPAAQWWPPLALDPGWVREHHDQFDLAHVHFGFDGRSPAELRAWVAALRDHGKPFVYTVHDLRNPHHATSGLHDEQLDVLVPAADALITLTPGAAEVITRRWQRTVHTLPHPHVVPASLLAPAPGERPDSEEQPAPRPDDPFVVGVHLKSLRANMAPVPVLECLAATVPDLPGGLLRVDVHTDVMTPGMRQHDPEVAGLVASLARRPGIRVEVHDFFSDEALWAYLGGLDLSVLPYRFGTHSGWLEACYDLGTTVLAPDCGFYREQRPCLTFGLGADGLDAASLAEGVRLAHARRPSWRAAREERHQERTRLAADHRALYAEVLAR